MGEFRVEIDETWMVLVGSGRKCRCLAVASSLRGTPGVFPCVEESCFTERLCTLRVGTDTVRDSHSLSLFLFTLFSSPLRTFQHFLYERLVCTGDVNLSGRHWSVSFHGAVARVQKWFMNIRFSSHYVNLLSAPRKHTAG